MKVGTCGATGRTNKADNLSFGDCYSWMNSIGEAIEMSITAHVGRIMLDVNGFAVATAPTGLGNDSVPHGANRSATLGSKIATGVGQIGFQDRVKTGLGEQRSDACEFQREPQKAARQALPFTIIVVALTLLLLEIDRRKFLSGVQ